MTFRDLRSGCCSTIRTPATRELVKTLPLQRIASAQRNFLTGPHTFIAIHSAPHLTSRFGSEPNAIKASVPKLFNCPGATKLLFTPSQEIGWLRHRGLSRPLDELTTPWDRSRIWSRKSPQTHQGFRLISASACALQPLGSRAVQKHNPSDPSSRNHLPKPAVEYREAGNQQEKQ